MNQRVIPEPNIKDPNPISQKKKGNLIPRVAAKRRLVTLTLLISMAVFIASDFLYIWSDIIIGIEMAETWVKVFSSSIGVVCALLWGYSPANVKSEGSPQINKTKKQ